MLPGHRFDLRDVVVQCLGLNEYGLILLFLRTLTTTVFASAFGILGLPPDHAFLELLQLLLQATQSVLQLRIAFGLLLHYFGLFHQNLAFYSADLLLLAALPMEHLRRGRLLLLASVLDVPLGRFQLVGG